MTDASNNTAVDAIQIDEDILSYTVSNEAPEAAAGTERAIVTQLSHCFSYCDYCRGAAG